MMVGKNRIKLINSLQYKKFRTEHGLFTAERETVVGQLTEMGYIPVLIIHTSNVNIEHYSCSKVETDKNTMKKISNLNSVPEIIGVFKIKEPEFNIQNFKNNLTLVCDDIQNPGNLGTLIRVANWFGVENIICSSNSVDCYNPKVIQASSGAIAKVNIFYKDLETVINAAKNENIEIIGTFPDAENIYKTDLNKEAFIVLGNEGQGISNSIVKIIDKKLAIPNFANSNSVESLNISIAASIILSEFKRR